MKNKLIILTIFILGLLCYAARSQDTTTTNTGKATLTADQLATVNKALLTGIAQLPAKDQDTVNLIVKCLGAAMIAGRLLYGFAKGGFWQACHGLFTGSNTPNPPGNIPKGATLLKCLALVALPALLLTGCGTTQVMTTSSGSGFKGQAAVPLPIPGANMSVLELALTVGAWKNNTVVQPVSTNSQLYVPAIAVTQKTRGNQNVSGTTGSNTNAGAGIIAGEFDETTIITGNAIAKTTDSAATNSTSISGK